MIPEPQHEGEFLALLGIPLDRIGNGQYTSSADSKKRGAISMEEGRILGGIVMGADVLEIGTGLGVSTLCLAQTARRLATVDPDPWVHERLSLPQMVERYLTIEDVEGFFQVVFIDGEHDAESVRRDIRDARKRLSPGGLIAFHDTNQDPVLTAIGEFSWRCRLIYPTAGRLMVCLP